jgi:ATP:ADP antiporter, AAA family
MNAVRRWLGWALPATPRERAATLWSFAYFFTLLAGNYVLRPLRDQMGIAGGVKNLPWLFTATFVTLVVAQPAYGALVAKLPRAHRVVEGRLALRSRLPCRARQRRRAGV